MSRRIGDMMERAHRYELDLATHCAVAIALARGPVHVGLVVEELVRRGVIEPERPEGEPRNRWLGLLFRRPAGLWQNTGTRTVVSNRARGSHKHSVVVWRLADGADTAPFLVEPERPAGWCPAPKATSAAPRIGVDPESCDARRTTEAATPTPPMAALPFDPKRAAIEVEYLEKKARMRGEEASPVIAALVTWLRAAPTGG